jgi:hypothetical protein
MCSGTASVNNPLRDPLVVEMGYFLPQDKVLQQGWPTRPCAQGVLVIGDTYPLIGGEGKVFAVFALSVKRFQLLIPRIRGFQAS